MGAGNDVDGHKLADAPRRGGARIGRRFDGAHIAAHHHGDVAGADVFLADQRDVGGLYHRIGRLDGPDQSAGFDETQRFTSRVRHFRRNSNRLRHMRQLNYHPRRITIRVRISAHGFRTSLKATMNADDCEEAFVRVRLRVWRRPRCHVACIPLITPLAVSRCGKRAAGAAGRGADAHA